MTVADQSVKRPIAPLLFGKRKPADQSVAHQYAGTDTEVDIKRG